MGHGPKTKIFVVLGGAYIRDCDGLVKSVGVGVILKMRLDLKIR